MVAKFINIMMLNGKKSIAEKILYDALEIIKGARQKRSGRRFQQRHRQGEPWGRGEKQANGRRPPTKCRWRFDRTGSWRWPCAGWWMRRASATKKSMTVRLAGELMDASEERGSAVKKREDTHKMAEANKAFAHYRF